MLFPSAHCFGGDIQGQDATTLFYTIATGFVISFFCSSYVIFLCVTNKEKTILTKLTFIQAICDILFSIAYYIETVSTTTDWCGYDAVMIDVFVNGSLYSLVLLSMSTYFEKRAEQEKYFAKLNKFIIIGFIIICLHAILEAAIINVHNNVIQFFVGFFLTGTLIISICFFNLRLLYKIKVYKVELEDWTPVICTISILFVWIEGIYSQMVNLGAVNNYQLFLVTSLIQELVGSVNFVASYRRIKILRKMYDSKVSISSKTNGSVTCQMYQALIE